MGGAKMWGKWERRHNDSKDLKNVFNGRDSNIIEANGEEPEEREIFSS